MVLQCVICREAIHISSRGQPTCAMPCGHVFHAICIRKWWLESFTCPCCRSVGTPIRLFFDGSNESVVSPPTSTSKVAALEKTVFDLNKQVKSGQQKANIAESKISKLQDSNDQLSTDNTDLKRHLNTAEDQLTAFKRDVSKLKNEVSVYHRYRAAQAEVSRLNAEMETLRRDMSNVMVGLRKDKCSLKPKPSNAIAITLNSGKTSVEANNRGPPQEIQRKKR